MAAFFPVSSSLPPKATTITMFKSAIIASLVASASAFAPAQTGGKTSTALAADLSKELGAMTPLGFFDPLQLCKDGSQAKFDALRERELKHGRVSMLAVVGWPLAELWDKPIADTVGLPSLLTKSGESPSLLNGGLDKIDVAYWVAVAALAGIIELENAKMKEERPKEYIPGDCNFDPLNFLPADKEGKMKMMTKEIKHGRIAMMAILGFAIQEAIYGIPVVQETPFFFTPAF